MWMEEHIYEILSIFLVAEAVLHISRMIELH